jgi:O-phospho-L-seryl-tRNASec:L-selenocysteinyl-tRNA synthase
MQPKAIGSTILNRLTNQLVLNLLKRCGLSFIKACIVSPMATGASLTFCMLSIRQTKPTARYVLMPRIDQKSCIKSVLAAGYTLIIVENKIENEYEIRTDLEAVESKILELKAENIACVFSTSSCFAPRSPDRVEELAVLCKKYDIFHLINNAYGLQSSKSTHLINQVSSFSIFYVKKSFN